jgi:hypothetical protein
MGLYTTKPVHELDEQEFREIIRKKPLEPSPHAFDHISLAQRKVFKDEDLTNLAAKETPRKVYLQENGNYAAYYRIPEGYRKLVIAIEKDKATIVTFMDTPELPRVRL